MLLLIKTSLYLYSNTSTCCSTKTYERISSGERSIVNTHSIVILKAKFAVGMKENQDRLPTFYWLPKLQKRPYKARFIANSSSCTTTILSKLLTSRGTAVKKHWITYFDTVYERDGINYFSSIKNPMKFSINLNLKTVRPQICLHMIFFYPVYYVTSSSYKR